MFKKISFLLSFALAQTADKVLDLLWLYYVYLKTNAINYVILFALVIIVVRMVIFLLVRELFYKASFYGHYILAFSFVFFMILLVNKLNLDLIIFPLIILKEVFSAFRVTGTKAFLNQVAYSRSKLFVGVNVIGYIVYPIAILIVKYFIDKQITDQIFTVIALLISPATILTFRLYSKSHKFIADQDLRVTLGSSVKVSIVKKILGYLNIMMWPLAQIAFTYFFVYAQIKGYDLWVVPFTILLGTMLLLGIVDKFDKTTNRYAEYSGKIVETILFFVAGLLIFILV